MPTQGGVGRGAPPPGLDLAGSGAGGADPRRPPRKHVVPLLSPCALAVSRLVRLPTLRLLREEMLVVASGKTPPYDAGRYEACRDIGESQAAALPTKFFLVRFRDWGVLPGPLPGEAGVCLPAVCRDEDMRDALHLVAQVAPVFGNVSIAERYQGSAWPVPRGRVLFPNPSNDRDDLVPWGVSATVASSIAGLLGAIVVVATCCSARAARAAARRSALLAGRGGILGGAGDDDSACAAEGGDGGARGSSMPAGGRATRTRAAQPPIPRASRAPRCLEAFSLAGEKGSLRLLTKVDTKRPTDCLDGIKVLSMFFIVLGHGCLEAKNVAGYRNMDEVLDSPFERRDLSADPVSSIFMSGQLCVDTFLFISGFLLSHVSRRRPTPVLLGALLRYCRLLPLLGFVMMMYICVSPHLASGPFAPRYQSEVFGTCKGSAWWSQLFLISDWYPWYTVRGGCMGWAWYLSVDMSFAIVGMVLLNVWKRRALAGWALAALLFFSSIALTIQQALYYNLQYDPVDISFHAYAHYLYTRPYVRFPGFCIGLVAPWALAAAEERQLRRRRQQLQQRPAAALLGPSPPMPPPPPRRRQCSQRAGVAAASLAAVAVLAACVFLPARNIAPAGASHRCEFLGCWSRWQNALWIGLSRPAWAAAWLVLTLACYLEWLPALNSVLAASVFRPLSNLTFGAYLTHPLIIKVLAANRTDYYHFSYGDALGRGVCYFLATYVVSVLTWCLVERPFASMVARLVPRRSGPAGARRAPGAAARSKSPGVEEARAAAAAAAIVGGRPVSPPTTWP